MTAELALSGPLRGPLRKRASHLWRRAPHDWYQEPPWVSQRLFEAEAFEGEVVDPACGGGNIIRSARAAGLKAIGWDLVDRGFPGTLVRDFLDARGQPSNIVCNQPFGIAERFVSHALARTLRKACVLLPANWVQGDKRARWLATTPLTRVLFICPRPSMPPGEVIAAGAKPGNGTTDYAWFVWAQGYSGRPEIGWLHRDAH